MTSPQSTSAPGGSPPTQPAPRALLATAVTAAVRAAEIIRRAAGEVATLAWQEKRPADFVSEVDLAAERAIADVIAGRHPDAVLIAEETAPGAMLSEGLAFVVDPLDGTTNFLHGYPQYAVSIAAMHGTEVIAGAVLNVPTGELFTATAGGGARRNGEPISVSAITDPARALLGTGYPFKHQELLAPYLPQLERVTRATSGVRRAGSAALDLADVACGRFDAFWELMLAPWDIAAGVLLVREAGGVITDAAGDPIRIAHGPVVAGNTTMHAWLLKTLREPGTSALERS